MRVLLVTEATSAGVGRHVADLAGGLLERGCEVELVYSRARIDEAFEEGLGAPGLSAHALEMHRAPGPRDAGVLWRLWRHVRARGPFDVVHAHSSKAGALVRALPLPGRRGRGRAGVVYTPHCVFTMNPDLGRAAFQATRAVERLLARRTDALVAVSPSEHDHLVGLGIDPARVHCIPNGVGTLPWRGRAEARAEFGLAESDVAVGFVGRLWAQKDPLLMLRAFAHVASGAPRAILLMTGDGPLTEEARRAAHELGLGERVRWLGARPATEVMPAFDLYAMSSRYEAMPYVLLEALSCGLPIVSTAVGGSRVAVVEGETGAIARDHTPEGLAAAMAPFLLDGGLRERCAQAARERARQFTVDTMVDATLDLYGTLGVARPVPRPASGAGAPGQSGPAHLSTPGPTQAPDLQRSLP